MDSNFRNSSSGSESEQNVSIFITAKIATQVTNILIFFFLMYIALRLYYGNQFHYICSYQFILPFSSVKVVRDEKWNMFCNACLPVMNHQKKIFVIKWFSSQQFKINFSCMDKSSK